MTYDRAMELLDDIAENATLGNSISGAISKLLNLGFTKSELVNDFCFSANDVYNNGGFANDHT